MLTFVILEYKPIDKHFYKKVVYLKMFVSIN